MKNRGLPLGEMLGVETGCRQKKYFVSSKNVSNFALSKNGELCIVYPFNVQFLRLISMEATYPSAVEMRCNRRRNEQKKRKTSSLVK